MCWNAEVSLNTFMFGFISAIIVLLLNQIKYYYVIIVMSFTVMQLLEYFTWKNINNKKVIRYLSLIGIHLILLQLLLLNYFFAPKKIRNILIILIIFFYLLYLIFSKMKLKMDKAENGHLRWHWIDENIIWISVALLFYLIPSFSNIYLFIFLFGTLVYSLYNYYKYNTWGSMWCYISNLLWIFLILCSIYLKFKPFFLHLL